MAPYAPFYCEENVWHLARDPAFARRARSVIFITNAYRRCAVFAQRAAPEAGEPVVWDYHVVLAVRDDDTWTVWDPDSTLGMPVDAERYLAESFPTDALLPALLLPRFRVIDADAYVRVFASDRGHMRRADGSWQAPPPPWPAILPDGAAPNLARFIDLDAAFVGDVLDLRGLRARLRRAPRNG